MSTFNVVVGVIVLLAIAIGAEIYMKRGKKRPLSHHHPNKSRMHEKNGDNRHNELGYEATDLEMVRKMEQTNRRLNNRYSVRSMFSTLRRKK